MLGRCAFRCFHSNISIPRLSWSIWTWCLCLFRFYRRFLSQGSSSRDGVNEVGEFVDDQERMVADFDFRGWLTPWALTLVSLTLIVRPQISYALANC